MVPTECPLMLVPLQPSSPVKGKAFPGFLTGRKLDWEVRTGCPSHIFIASPKRHLVMLSGKGSLDRETEAWEVQ